MSINYLTDSDNVTHQVWAQQQNASCAVASIWMARNQAKQMTFNEGEWPLAWRLYYQVVQGMELYPEPPAPMSLELSKHVSPNGLMCQNQNNEDTFANKFSRHGTYMSQVNQALRNDGLRVTLMTGFMPGTVVDASRLSDTTPAIVLLGWYNGDGDRVGGHFIVASRKTRAGNIVYLDPWGGRLNELGIGRQYGATGWFEQVIYISA